MKFYNNKAIVSWLSSLLLLAVTTTTKATETWEACEKDLSNCPCKINGKPLATETTIGTNDFDFYYKLQNNLSCDGPYVNIFVNLKDELIESKNIIIDLNGKSLTPVNGAVRYGIYYHSLNSNYHLMIKNGKIGGFRFSSIVSSGIGSISIENVDFKQQQFSGAKDVIINNYDGASMTQCTFRNPVYIYRQGTINKCLFRPGSYLYFKAFSDDLTLQLIDNIFQTDTTSTNNQVDLYQVQSYQPAVTIKQNCFYSASTEALDGTGGKLSENQENNQITAIGINQEVDLKNIKIFDNGFIDGQKSISLYGVEDSCDTLSTYNRESYKELSLLCNENCFNKEECTPGGVLSNYCPPSSNIVAIYGYQGVPLASTFSGGRTREHKNNNND